MTNQSDIVTPVLNERMERLLIKLRAIRGDPGGLQEKMGRVKQWVADQQSPTADPPPNLIAPLHAAETVAVLEKQDAESISYTSNNLLKCAEIFVKPSIKQAVLAPQRLQHLAKRVPWIYHGGVLSTTVSGALQKPGSSAAKMLGSTWPETIEWFRKNGLLSSQELGDWWPAEAAFLDVAEWLLKHTAVLDGENLVARDPRTLAELLARKVYIAIKPKNSDALSIRPGTLALIYQAEVAVTEGLRRPSMAIDASRYHHDLLVGWRQLPKARRETAEREIIKGKVRLLIPGKAVQLTLPLEGENGLHDATIRALRELQGWEGLRHWAAMQRLFAIEGGRVGSVRWTLDAHMDALGYSARSRESRATQERVVRQVEMLTKVELEVEESANRHSDPRYHSRPLILVTEKTGRLEGSKRTLDGMVLQINPLLYQGVRDEKTGKPGKDWLPAPAELAQVNHTRHPHTLALGLILPIRWRWALWDGQDCVRLTGEKLLDLAGIKYLPNRASRAWEKLRRDLDKAKHINLLEYYIWSKGEPWSLNGICELHPPMWVLDRAIHKLKPVEKPPKGLPLTGGELKEWRKKQGLSQEAAAQKLKVGERAIRRAEAQSKKQLTPKLRRSLEIRG